MGMSLEEIKQHHNSIQSGARKRYHGAIVKFSEETYLDQAATQQNNGIPKYSTRDVISIRFPGGDETVRRVEPQDTTEYAEQWVAYKAGKEQPLDGTPLEMFPPMPKAVVEELRYFQVRTIEQLAELTDEAKRKLGPLSSWQKKASEWLGAAKSKQSEVVALKEQLKRQTERADRLEHQMTILMQRIDATEGNNFSESFRGSHQRSE